MVFNDKKRLVKELNVESENRLAVAALQRSREYQCKQELVRQLHVTIAFIVYIFLNIETCIISFDSLL